MTEVGEENMEAYPLHLLLRTLPAIASFLALGICSVINGPSLLDLRDLLDSSIGEISFLFMLGSIGTMSGCFALGLLMDRFVRLRYLIIGLLVAGLGLFTSFIPYSQNLVTLYCLGFFSGFCGGALDAGAQVLLLNIWKGRESGPYMHTLHFMFGIGAFIAPVIAKPFLSNVEEVLENENLTVTENFTSTTSEYSNRSGSDLATYISYNGSSEMDLVGNNLTIKTLYPLIGLFTSSISLGFLFYHIMDLKNEVDADLKEEEKETDKQSAPVGRKLLVLVILMIFFFFYVGLEVAFGTFLTTFAVKCKLGLSRGEGSYLTAVFWGSFACMRGVAIPAAIYIKPEIIMFSSCFLCVVGSVFLSLFAETYVYLLYTCTAVMGIGMASIFATGLLWLEKRMEITNRIGAVMTISAALGAKIFPVMVGQTVEKYPMSFMYIMLGISTGCTILFVSTSILGRDLEKSNLESTSDSKEEEELPLNPIIKINPESDLANLKS